MDFDSDPRLFFLFSPLCSGLCTIKPTLGRLSREGVMSAMPQYFMQSAPGPLVHNVEDLAIVMRALCNSGVQQQLDPTTPLLPFKEDVYGADTKLRIGYFVDDGWFTPGYSCQRAVLETVELLKELGHEVAHSYDAFYVIVGLFSFTHLLDIPCRSCPSLCQLP
jgi:Asp-tRNA(Asn)/Glu-tRNA(Gln) amidotransferase A subunit family amidase